MTAAVNKPSSLEIASSSPALEVVIDEASVTLEACIDEALSTLDSVLKQFLSEEDVADSSRALYARCLKRYFSWLTSKGLSLDKITAKEILSYKDELLSKPLDPNKPKLSSLTAASYLVAVRKFYSWAESHKLYPDVAKGIKLPKREQKFRKQPLSLEKTKELLTYCQGQSLRDAAIVNLLVRTGLRTIELVRADVADIKIRGSQRVLEIQGKGRSDKDNFIVLTDKAYGPLKAYLDSRPSAKPSDPLFISESNNSKGQRLTTRMISSIAKDSLRAIMLDDRAFTAHSLRHTTGVNILRAGGSLEDVQLTLRHTNPATTRIYTHTLDEQRRLERSGESLIDSLY
jgi:integrase/recombinase XerC/integrase/recombinase XerD